VGTIWRVEFDERARRELRKLNQQIQSEIIHYLESRIATADDPRRFGRPLTGSLAGLWRYRVRDWRLLCKIEDDRFIVLVVTVGHRKVVYDR
jgi:mRNA interferase RelE/StbE